MKAALRPGGVIYFGIHLYTSNTGHHDIRAFTGGAGNLPPWAHLRALTKGDITSSAWLNQWRLRDWRAMLAEHAPGYEEYRETYDEAANRRLLSPDIRTELSEFEDEELLTTDVFFYGESLGPDSRRGRSRHRASARSPGVVTGPLFGLQTRSASLIDGTTTAVRASETAVLVGSQDLSVVTSRRYRQIMSRIVSAACPSPYGDPPRAIRP
jgi:hypothetical protein